MCSHLFGSFDTAASLLTWKDTWCLQRRWQVHSGRSTSRISPDTAGLCDGWGQEMELDVDRRIGKTHGGRASDYERGGHQAGGQSRRDFAALVSSDVSICKSDSRGKPERKQLGRTKLRLNQGVSRCSKGDP